MFQHNHRATLSYFVWILMQKELNEKHTQSTGVFYTMITFICHCSNLLWSKKKKKFMWVLWQKHRWHFERRGGICPISCVFYMSTPHKEVHTWDCSKCCSSSGAKAGLKRSIAASSHTEGALQSWEVSTIGKRQCWQWKILTDGLQSPRGLTNNSSTKSKDCSTGQNVRLLVIGHQGEVVMVTILFAALGRRGV